MMLSIHVSLVINLTSKLFYAFNMSSFSVSCLKRHMYCTFSLKVYIFLWLFLYQKKVMAVISPLSQQQAKIFGPVFFVCRLYCAFQLVFFFFNLLIFIQHVFFPFFMKNPVGLLFARSNVRKWMKKQEARTNWWRQ